MSQNKVIIISSVSGGGKTTLVNYLKKHYKSIQPVITATTRQPREGEKNKIHYYFYTHNQFKKKLSEGKFLEYANVHGEYYGVPRKQVESKLKASYSPILNIDVQGMQSILQTLGKEKILSLFIKPPNLEVWEKRLRHRHTETEKQIQKRIEQGKKELEETHFYDYVIINDFWEETLEKTVNILKKENIIS